jgi:AraC-like DNA-binding protein
MKSVAALDRLSAVLERFRIQTRLSFSGAMCGLHRFPQREGVGYLHLLRSGSVEVTYPNVRPKRESIKITEPTVFLYARSLAHHFRNPPKNGSDFTCAEIEFDGGSAHLIARALPDAVVIPLREIEGLQASLELLFAETSRVQCGQRILADRLFEVVLIQLLRWLLDHPTSVGIDTGLVAGLSSPKIAKALTAIHEAPEGSWSVEKLACESAMSRTAFATEFKALVGKSPAEYLAEWRMAIVKSRLRDGASLKLLAAELGYSNQSALSRAFTNLHGQSPREWLSESQSAIDD